MIRLAAVVLAAASIGMTVPGRAEADTQPHNPDAKRVLTVGDSITQGKTVAQSGGYSWRYFLWKRFEQAGTQQTVDFVGHKTGVSNDMSPSGQDPSRYADPNFDYDHAAVAGAQLDDPTPLEGQRSIASLVREFDPHIIMAVYGINNLRAGGQTAEQLLAKYDDWVDNARAAKPDVDFSIARHPWHWADVEVKPFNALLVDWAKSKSTSASRIVVPVMDDSYTEADTYDGLHPTEQGERKIADMMASGLRALGLTLVADPILMPPATPGLVMVRQGNYVVVKWSERARATGYVVRCNGVDRYYYTAGIEARYHSPGVTTCRVRATNRAGTSEWSPAETEAAAPAGAARRRR